MSTPISFARVKKIVAQFPHRSILVVGDTMLDEYLWGDVTRISPEAPVPVVEVSSTSLKLGGAANVASNLKALGVTPHLVSLCGADASGERMRGLLQDLDMPSDGLFSSRERPTTLKTRIVAQHQQVVRADHEKRAPASADEEALMINHIRSVAGDVDGVILSDYAKGVLSPSVVRRTIEICREHNLYIAVDPKTHDLTTYAGASVITPNLKEALLAMGEPQHKCTIAEVQDIGWRILSHTGLPYLLVTLGEMGMAIFENEGRKFAHLHTAAREVYDVTGAGDTVISTFTAAACCGAIPLEAAFIANIAAGITVAEVGTASVPRDALLERCREHAGDDSAG